MSERLLTAAQLADRLQLRESTVKLWGRKGRIPRIVLACNTIRYRMKDVVNTLIEADRGREADRRGQSEQ